MHLNPLIFNRRNIIIVTGIIVMVIVGLLTFRLSEKNLTVTKPFAANFNLTKQMGDNTLYYYSGSSFVSYDLTSHKSTALTPVYTLPAHLTEIKWSEQGALFFASDYSELDQLYKILVDKKLTPNAGYWWLVNFKTSTISLVGNPATGAQVRSVAWQGSDAFVYNEKVNDQTRSVVRSDMAQATSVIGTVPEASDILSANGGKLTYTENITVEKEDAKNLMVLDIVSKKSEAVIKEIDSVLATNDQGSVLAINHVHTSGSTETEEGHSHGARGPLVLYNASTGKTKTITSDFTGSAAWHGDDWVAIGYNSKEQVNFLGTDGKMSRATLTAPNPKDETPHYNAIGLNQTGIILSDTLNQLVYGSEKIVENLPALPDYDKLVEGIVADTYYVSYVETSKQYSAYILADPYQANVAAVIERLKSMGYDPYQLKLRWYADETVTTGFKLAPGVNPIEEPNPVTIEEDFETGD